MKYKLAKVWHTVTPDEKTMLKTLPHKKALSKFVSKKMATFQREEMKRLKNKHRWYANKEKQAKKKAARARKHTGYLRGTLAAARAKIGKDKMSAALDRARHRAATRPSKEHATGAVGERLERNVMEVDVAGCRLRLNWTTDCVRQHF